MRLVLAFAGIGLLAGFMVAASESPAVSAALPVLAGLVTAGITALSSRIDVGKAMQRVESLRERLTDAKVAVSDDTVDGLVHEHRTLLRHAEATTRTLGSLTLAFVVCFAVGLGAGLWGRLDGALARAVSPVVGPWARAGAGAGTAMPSSSSAALYWLALEQRLRQAGVPDRTILALYRSSQDEVAAAARERAGGDDPTPDDLLAAWIDFVRDDAPEGSGGTGGTLAIGGMPAVPMLRPGTLRMEAGPLESLLEDVRDRLERLGSPPSIVDPSTLPWGGSGQPLGPWNLQPRVAGEELGPVFTVVTDGLVFEVALDQLDEARFETILDVVGRAGAYEASVVAPAGTAPVALADGWSSGLRAFAVDEADDRVVTRWAGQDPSALADLLNRFRRLP